MHKFQNNGKVLVDIMDIIRIKNGNEIDWKYEK